MLVITKEALGWGRMKWPHATQSCFKQFNPSKRTKYGVSISNLTRQIWWKEEIFSRSGKICDCGYQGVIPSMRLYILECSGQWLWRRWLIHKTWAGAGQRPGPGPTLLHITRLLPAAAPHKVWMKTFLETLLSLEVWPYREDCSEHSLLPIGRCQ